jgi:hypothetical protein
VRSAPVGSGSLLLAALLLASCGGNAEPAEITTEALVSTTSAATTSAVTTTTTPPPTTAAQTTTTSAAETSTTAIATTTTSTLPATICPIPPALPDGAIRFAGGSGDYDGDGQPDPAITYQAGPDTWRLRVTFADGGGTDVAILDAEDFAPPRHIGGFDIEGDGTDEIFVAVGVGASTVHVGLYDVAGCVATRVTAEGAPAVLPVGASIGNVSGIACPGDGTIQRVFAQYVDDDVYEGGFAPYALDGAALIALPGDGAGFTAEEAFALAVLDCGDLVLP